MPVSSRGFWVGLLATVPAIGFCPISQAYGAVTSPAIGRSGSIARGPATSQPPRSGSAAIDREEFALLSLLNAYRAQHGLGRLRLSLALTQASDWMSSDLAARNYFSHTDRAGRSPFSRMKAFGYDYNTYSGENLAAGNASAQATFIQWKNSPGHNANMLDANYKVVGIARVYDATSTYGWYWTTDFGGVVDTVLR